MQGTGIFGKLPCAGDFIARGLGQGVRPVLDRFLTKQLSHHAATPDLWPAGGLRAVIAGPNGPLLLCILPSHDTTERVFPIAACTMLNDAPLAEADRWADDVSSALQQGASVDEIVAALANVVPPKSGGPLLSGPAMWQRKEAPVDTQQVIVTLFETQ